MISFISAFNRTPEWIKHKSYEECAIRLLRSLRKNGGLLKDAHFHFFIDSEHKPDEAVISELKKLRCFIWYYGDRDMVMQSDAGSWSPKIYAVKHSAGVTHGDTTHCVWIDCDYYVNGDLRELKQIAESAQVTAPPMNLVTNFGAHPERDFFMWQSYYQYFNILYKDQDNNVIPPRVKTHVDKKDGWFYFTSSIMTWEPGLGFEREYFNTSKYLFNSGLQDCQKRYTQTSVPLTILKNGYTWDVIPRHLAYMYHLNGYKLENDEQYPVLIHYGDNVVTEISPKRWEVKW